jgi:hypothetical protein
MAGWRWAMSKLGQALKDYIAIRRSLGFQVRGPAGSLRNFVTFLEDPELARFCIIARGSATELEYQLLLARDLKLIQPKDYEELSAQTVEIKRMLTVLVQKLTAES